MAVTTANFGEAIVRFGNLAETVLNITSGGTTSLKMSDRGTLYITGTSLNHTIYLPDTTTLMDGQRWYVINNSLASVSVYDFTGNLRGVVRPNYRWGFLNFNGSWWNDRSAVDSADSRTWMPIPVTVTDGEYLTISQMLGGPLLCDGGSLYIPDGDVLLSQLLAFLGYIPPVGYHWTSHVIHTSHTALDITVGVGGTQLGSNIKNTHLGDVITFIIYINTLTPPTSCTYTCFRLTSNS